MIGLLAGNAPAVRHPTLLARVPLVDIQLLLPAAETPLLASEEQLALRRRHFCDEFSAFCDAVLPPRAARKAADVWCVEWSSNTNIRCHSSRRANNRHWNDDRRRQHDGQRQLDGRR